MGKFLISALLLALVYGVFGQDIAVTDKQVRPVKIEGEIIVDGLLDEEVWGRAAMFSDLWQQFPADTIMARGRTEVLMMYNNDYLYIGVRCYSIGPDFISGSLRRDYRLPGSDNFAVMFDTFNDKTNAFVFGVNPYGVLREALVANGGRERTTDFQVSWDNKWTGNATRYQDHWIGEMAIPFKTIRFREGEKVWRFNCYRNDTQINERSSWINLPQNRLLMDLSYTGELVWEEPPGKEGSNISLIPYGIAGVTRDLDDPDQTRSEFPKNIGMDAKVAITSGLNLDLTVNPDFSQVEVDQQVTNLDRFEILLPEKRQFFLENADLFGGFGQRRVNPFFTRRIGVVIDSTTGQNVQNPIYYGARLSGKVTDNFRIGMLNAQSAKEVESGLPSFNYSVATVQQKVFERSNISAIFVNKQAIKPDSSGGDFNSFNRVAGIEYRLASSNNKWLGKVFYHHAFQPEKQDHPFTHGVVMEYMERKYRLDWAHLIIGNGYNAELGYVPRKDFMLLSPEFELYFYPGGRFINTVSLEIDTRFFFQIGKDGNDVIKPWSMSERQTMATWKVGFADNTLGNFIITENDVTLVKNFDPTRLQADTSVYLPAGSRHHFIEFSGEYTSDQRKLLYFKAIPNSGQFYNGYRIGLAGELNYRIQPYGTLAMTWDYNHVKLKAPFVPSNIWIVGPKFDITFTKKMFWTTFVQYNNQLDNLNINTRFQWRFAPVSDFFLVYTNNYFMDPFTQFRERNRALVAKLTYWLNL